MTKKKDTLSILHKHSHTETFPVIIALSKALNFKMWSQDVKKAYIHGHDQTSAVYIKPIKDFGLASNQLIKIWKPLYGLKRSGDAWFQTHSTYLTQTEKIQPTHWGMSVFLNTKEYLDRLKTQIITTHVFRRK